MLRHHLPRTVLAYARLRYAIAEYRHLKAKLRANRAAHREFMALFRMAKAKQKYQMLQQEMGAIGIGRAKQARGERNG